jgi:hypothetical protein
MLDCDGRASSTLLLLALAIGQRSATQQRLGIASSLVIQLAPRGIH